jgi:hypothetical protein
MRPSRLVTGLAMVRMPIGAVVLVLLSATAAPAQITGPIPNTGLYEGMSNWNMWSGIGRSQVPEDAGREHEIERQYRETVNTKIPNRKPSNDPWRKIRPASTELPGKQHGRE